MSIWWIVIACVVLLLLFLSGIWYWWSKTRHRKQHPLTEEVSLGSGWHSALPGAAMQSPVPRADGKKPLYVDDNVLFTVYRPKVVAPGHWYNLLAYAHLAERRPDAAPDAPDPVKEVERDAKLILGVRLDAQLKTRQQSARPVPCEGELVFAPHVEGIIFNPPAQGVLWLRDIHRVEFEMTAAQQYDGQLLRGSLTIFLGGLILADIPLIIQADSSQSPMEATPCEQVQARPYRKIFPSYSRNDLHIVEDFERFVEATGDRYLRDVRTLRSGEKWQRRLEELIRDADVFQLFWSSNSIHSKFVRLEWEYALSLKRQNFIRPTFWEEPMPREENLPPEELACLHFHKLPVEISRKPPRARRKSAQTAPKVIPLLLISGIMLALVGGSMVFQLSKSTKIGLEPTIRPVPTIILGPSDPAMQDEELRRWSLMYMREFVPSDLSQMSRRPVIVETDGREVTLHDKLNGSLQGRIKVTVHDKIVTLDGFVADESLKQAIMKSVRRVGFQGIRDQITVEKQEKSTPKPSVRQSTVEANN